MSRRIVTEPELHLAAARLAEELPRGSVLWLQGDLGAGKTTFAHAFARARGVSPPLTSPTFTLAQRYEGPRGPLHHVDCYRLQSPDEAAELDWDQLTAGDVLLVEWPERAGAWAPAPSRVVALAHATDPGRRWLEIAPAPAGRP